MAAARRLNCGNLRLRSGTRSGTSMLRCTQRFLAVTLLLCGTARAGGPAYVAGASYFDPATKGAPVGWAQGAINYYTDQGDLSAILPWPYAVRFVELAFGL